MTEKKIEQGLPYWRIGSTRPLPCGDCRGTGVVIWGGSVRYCHCTDGPLEIRIRTAPLGEAGIDLIFREQKNIHGARRRAMTIAPETLKHLAIESTDHRGMRFMAAIDGIPADPHETDGGHFLCQDEEGPIAIAAQSHTIQVLTQIGARIAEEIDRIQRRILKDPTGARPLCWGADGRDRR